jgi:hypothetical protein
LASAFSFVDPTMATYFSANAVVVQIYLYIRYLMTIVAEAAAAIDISPIHQTSSNYLYTTLQKLLQYI